MTALTLYDDAPGFLADVRAHLEADEAENGLLLGLLSRLAASPPAKSPFLARLHAGEGTRGVAYLTPLNMIVSRGLSEGAEALVDALRRSALDIPGIVGPAPDVEVLARAWMTARGCEPGPVVEQMLYELREVDWPTGVIGRMRAMAEADVERVARWIWGFHRDALPHEPYAEAEALDNARLRPAQGLTFLWEVAGEPVAMAALSRPSAHGITVNAVYTPPEHRRHGYASALVAAVSDEGLKRGKSFCVLYTDLSNPTSNAIYQRIGYRPIARSRNVRFLYG